MHLPRSRFFSKPDVILTGRLHKDIYSHNAFTFVENIELTDKAFDYFKYNL